MKRYTLPARYRAANKAQENPHGALVVLVLFVLMCLLSARTSLASGQFSTIDAYTRACPQSCAKDVQSIARYIYKAARTDLEKARAIYIWLTSNISYDAMAYNSGQLGDQAPNSTLLSRKAVCSGFADLYTALGEALGLNIKTIVGYAKGYGYREGQVFTDSDHAWNAIQIDGKWRLFDATWGEGYGTTGNYGELICVKEFEEQWFNVDPEYFIFTHYAENPMENFLAPNFSFTLRNYQKLPTYKPADLIRFGHNPYSLLLAAKRTSKS